ncbi:MAG: metallophosphoesterase, partial [Clostridia bacterium]
FAAETATPISNLRVGHITDVHYFPLEHCYQEPFAEDYRQSDFYHSISGDTKLVLESGTLLNATVKSVISDAKSGIAPDVIVVSGDLTKNGERVSHVDVANALRFMQNEVRKVSGYSNFQVFVVPGNHDIYNSEAALYLRSNGKEYKTSSVNMTQFALIYAGLGYPNANLTGADGAINLLNYFEEDYWSSIVKDATGKITSPGFTGGYVASKNATNFDITYISDGLNYITPNHIEIGNDNNALSYAVSFKDNFAGYTLFAIDTTDREETTDIVPIRICKKAFIEFFSTPEKYNSHSFYLDTIKGKSSTEFTKLTVTYEEMLQKFDDGEYIYFGTKIDHITGGRITESCLNWMENYVATQNGDSSFAEETIIGTFHH